MHCPSLLADQRNQRLDIQRKSGAIWSQMGSWSPSYSIQEWYSFDSQFHHGEVTLAFFFNFELFVLDQKHGKQKTLIHNNNRYMKASDLLCRVSLVLLWCSLRAFSEILSLGKYLITFNNKIIVVYFCKNIFLQKFGHNENNTEIIRANAENQYLD